VARLLHRHRAEALAAFTAALEHRPFDSLDAEENDDV
jgi:hypothetical protein